jgi:hypothetical protein
MPIIDSQLVNIEIAISPDRQKSALRLNYQGQTYDLVQAFADRRLDFAQQKLGESLQQSQQIYRNTGDRVGLDEYLLVREVGYHSLWKLDRSIASVASSIESMVADRPIDLELQQASIWLFQELWVQWQNLLGTNQLQAFADNLLTVTPQLQSWVDLDRLLAVDALAPDPLGVWTESDFIVFDRQIYQLTQKKIGQKFGTQLTIEIVQSMPDLLKSRLSTVLNL